MYQRLTINLKGGWRTELLEGRQHLVVPAAILAEGVWEGSQGPIYYPAEELAESAPTWNNKPIVVYHPEEDGIPVSACKPSILNTRGIGRILNTKYEDDKLRTECWIDIKRADAIDSRVVKTIKKNEQVEVSTGLFMKDEHVSGEHNGKKYDIVGRNYKPDHLAALPDKIGAYSVKSGGGMLTVNQSVREPERTQAMLKRSLEHAVHTIGVTFVDNELSYGDVTRQLSDLLASKFGQPGKYWDGYVCDVYPSSVVFKDGYGADAKMWKIGFKVENEAVSLDGEAEEVVRVTEYKATGETYQVNAVGELVPKSKETEPMAFDKNKHLTSLIGNGWAEGDREWLSSLPDDRLEKIQPKSAAPTNNGTQQPPKPAGGTLQDLIANADPDTRYWYQNGQKAIAAQRKQLTEFITANARNPFTKEYLDARSLEELQGIAQLAAGQQQSGDAPQQGQPQQPAVLNNNYQPYPNYAGMVGAIPVMNAAPPADFLEQPN